MLNDTAMIILLMAMALPVAWFLSEFQTRRWLRLTLGTCALLMSFGVAYVVGTLERLNDNAWYGLASKELIDATIAELEAGHRDVVLKSLGELQREFRPTYEYRAHYDDLVKEAVTRMQGGPKKSP